MDLKDYREVPDAGMFEAIERRLRLRRWRRAGVVTLAVAALVAAVWAGLKVVDGVQGAEAGGQKSEVGISRPEAGGQKPEVGSRRSEVGGQKSEVGTRRTEDGGRKMEDGSRRPEVGGRNSEAASRNSEGAAYTSAHASHVPPLASHVPAAMPVLPESQVAPVQTDVDALIVDDQPSAAGVATATEPKSDPSAPVRPHEDNVLWAPNAIAPDYDDEAVREFRLVATSDVSDFRLVIMNRGGRQVYSSGDIGQGWDGTCDGMRVPQGAYVWVARFRDTDGHQRQERGTVTVIR